MIVLSEGLRRMSSLANLLSINWHPVRGMADPAPRGHQITAVVNTVS